MPKPRRKKTDTIKERAVYVYLPSHEMAKEWKGLAKKQGVSISKFVQEHVENSLNQEREKGAYQSRLDLIKKTQKLEEDTSRLREETRMYRLLSQNLEKEIKRYRTQPFVEEEFTGKRGYEKELIEALRKRGFVPHEDLWSILNIDPKDTDLTKAVNKQLESLEAYGLVESTQRGWEWKK